MRYEEQRRLAREKIAATVAAGTTDNVDVAPLEVEGEEDHAEDLISEKDSPENELAGDFTRGCNIALDDGVSDDDDYDDDDDASEDDVRKKMSD